MSVASQPAIPSDWLLTDDDQFRYSREVITVLSGQNLLGGAVLGKVTASGKMKVYDPAAVDGSQTVAGILLNPVDASAADAKGVAIVREAIVKHFGLVWKAGLNAGQITTGEGGLLALGIVVRKDA